LNGWHKSLVIVLGIACSALAQADPATAGKEVFDRNCIHCHAPGMEHPGTLQLAVTRGENLAVLEDREDLTAEYVKHIVRHGLRAMPPFVPADITDDQLEALTDYLAGQE
jgi:mono/diheme cytochrome c family protein